MFKKRKNKKDEDDDEAASPTITVSIPQDDFDLVSPTFATHHPSAGTTNIRESERQSTAEQRNVLLHHPWKPWDPQKLAMSNKREPLQSQTSSPGHSPSPSSLSPDSSTTKKTPSMMLNLSNVFSGSGSGSKTVTNSPGSAKSRQANNSTGQQVVEAQLWNADLLATSPHSPAGPRYIPATAGIGANSRGVSGTGAGRFANRILGSGGSSESSSWRSFGQSTTPTKMPFSPGPMLSSGSSSFPSSPSLPSTPSKMPLSTQGHPTEKPHYRSALSSRSQAGNSGGQIIPAMTSPSLNVSHDSASATSNRLYEGTRTKSARGAAEDEDGVSDILWGHGKEPSNPSAYANESSGYGHRDEDLQDRKNDRPRRQSHSGSLTPLILSHPKRALRAQLFCLRRNRRLHPCFRIFVLIYLVGSVCFTTFHLIFRDSTSKERLRKSFEYTEQQLRIRQLLDQSGIRRKVVSAFDVEAQNYSSHQWAFETFDIDNSKAIARVSEDYMLSKAFNEAMYPTRIIPFYFRASFRDEEDDDEPHGEDHHGWPWPPDQDMDADPLAAKQTHVEVDPSFVTITTLITPDRYGVFLKLVKQYRGPISVATHIRKGEDQDAKFHELNEFFQQHTVLRKYVDLHVIVDAVDYQLNMWRNVARVFARTDYFMMLDVDFHIPSGLKSHLHRDPRIQELLSSGAALVIPAFEYDIAYDPKDSKYFPGTKEELIPLLEKKHIRVFHDSFPPGHAATDTPRWIQMSKRQFIDQSEQQRHRAPPKGRVGFEEDYDPGILVPEEGDDASGIGSGKFTEEEQRTGYLGHEGDGARPYKVTNFEPKYEPYIVLKRDGTPWCDERFVGYGANKAACLFEIYISGIDFWVVPEDFLIHQYHDYPTTNRKNGRILNKQLFTQFQQEICFSMLQRMIVSGEWYTAKADNLRHQCEPFDNFLKSADEFAKEFEERHPDSLLKEPVFVADERDFKKRKERLQKALVLGSGGANSGEQYNDRSRDRYEGSGDGTNLGEQTVDDEKHRNPFMDRPKGRSWGGIQPRTYYIPPPFSFDENGIPLEGIDVNVAVDGEGTAHEVVTEDRGHEGSQGPNQDNDLTGEKLEQFRQGVIFPDESRFSFNEDNDNKGTDRGRDNGHDLGLDNGQDVRKSEDDRGDQNQQALVDHPHLDKSSPLTPTEHDAPRHGDVSFEDLAQQVEEKYRWLEM